MRKTGFEILKSKGCHLVGDRKKHSFQDLEGHLIACLVFDSDELRSPHCIVPRSFWFFVRYTLTPKNEMNRACLVPSKPHECVTVEGVRRPHPSQRHHRLALAVAVGRAIGKPYEAAQGLN